MKIGEETRKYIHEAETYSASNYHPLPVVINEGEGCWVWDADGNKYMDFLSAYSALSHGHRHPRIVKALKQQADRVTLTSRAFHNDMMGRFLKKLVEYCDMEMALPMNTGAEAVETAIKTVRKWGYEKKGIEENKAEIIVCENNFHGRTTTIVGFSSEDQYKAGFGPFTPGFLMIPFGDISALRIAITENTAAFLVEPIQAEGGILVPPEGWMKEAYDICKKNNVLFVLDEIQTGLCRTGKRFAYQHENGVKPDMLILGKTLGGGVYPVSATVSSREIMSVFHPGDHGSTFGGNPLGAAVGLAALESLEEEEMDRKATELGDYFMQQLKNMNSKFVKEIRGKGLLIGVEIKPEFGVARPFCEKLAEEGLLCKETHESVLRIAPPLIITKEQIDWAMEKIRKIFCP